MEFLLLGLAGLGGLALLLQQKPVPSNEEVFKALQDLEKNPDDPDANTIAGKYKAFVLGDYDEAMQYLKKSKDTTLKTLADHETDAAYTVLPDGKIKMGDEWVAAAKKFPALSPIFYDRASQWYVKAWPALDAALKLKARERGRKLAASRPPGGARKALPKDWFNDPNAPGGNPATLDGTVARTGSYSVKLAPADPKIKGSFSQFNSDLIPVSGKVGELSAYILSDNTESASDRLFVSFFDQAGTGIQTVGPFTPVDVPFWSRVGTKIDIPPNAVRAKVGVALNSKNGNMWVDDVSFKVDGKELLKNQSFE